MTRLKNALISTVSILIVLALLGVFASVGLAVVGAMFCVGLIALTVLFARNAFASAKGGMTPSDTVA